MKISNVIILFLGVGFLFVGLNSVLAQDPDDRFEFEGVPANIQPFDDFTFTLKALDAAGEVDDNYVGEVHFFTESDVNAVLPDDYQFLLSDAGVKNFSGFSFFTEEGIHELNVVDLEDDTLVGSITVNVSSSGGVGATDGGLNVTSPTSGTSSKNIIRFAGTTDPGLEVRIYDNGEILDTVDASSNGSFSVDSPVLPDGPHVFTFETDVSEAGPISVNINTQGIEVSSVSFNPQDYSAGAVSTITVNFAQTVSSASVVINGVKTVLQKSDTLGRAYSGSITMPAVSGTYNLSVIADGITISNVGTLNVSDAFSLDGVPGGSQITFFVPSQVLGVQASGVDKRVNLSWQPATDNTGIDHYAIFYGTSQNSLTSRVDTNDSSTTWYVPNLVNGQTYYFQVYGVDTDGNIGDQGSSLIAAVPGVAGYTSLHGASNGQVLVDQTSGTGSGGVVFLILGSLMIGYIVNKKIFS